MASSTSNVDSYEQLRARIISGLLKPGSRLSQEDIAKELGLSRVPLREAIRKLEGERLIVGVPRRGATVPDLSDEEVVDLYAIRLLLEPVVIRRATEVATAEQLADLIRRVDDMADVVSRPEAFFKADDQVIRAIFDIPSADLFVDITLMVRDRGEYLRFAFTTQAGLVESMLVRRRATVAAIATGRPELAEACMRVDLIEGRDSLLLWRNSLTRETESNH